MRRSPRPRPRPRCRPLVLVALSGLAVLAGVVGGLGPFAPFRVARANGAFPAPFRIFVPANLPNDTTVTTNFGLISSRDGGRTWAWSCEHGASDLGSLYQQAADGGSGRILGLAKSALVFTDDDGCTWSVASGLPSGELVDDSFIDPGNPAHVLAISHHGTGTTAVFGLFSSSNAGTLFSASPLLAPAPGLRLDGVEIARSNASRIYVTTSPWAANGTPPRILRSDDGGKTFATLDASALVTGGTLGIAAVDPQDPDRVYLRSSDADERLLISNDGGRTLTVALTADPGQQLSAFFRSASGALFAAAFDSVGGTLFRSTDAGASFQPLATGLHVGSIAERNGALYVLADGLNDPFLVGISRDNGETFETLLDYTQVAGVKTCGSGTDLRNACATSCLNLNNADVFAPMVCSTLVGGPAGSADGASATSGSVASGCGGCALGGAADPRSRAGDSWFALVSALGAAAGLSTRRRRHRAFGRRKERRKTDSDGLER